jgi:hypothetical protein
MLTESREADFNPYAAPRADLGHDDPTDVYQVVSTRVSYAEYWRLSNGPISFLVLALFKTLRIRFQFQGAVSYPRSIDLVPTGQIPAHVLERWRGHLDECEALGLRLVLCYKIPTIGVTKETLAAVLRSDDGLRNVGLVYTRVEAMTIVREKVIISAGSELEGGRRAHTRNDREYLDLPPSYIVQVVRNRSVGELLDRHRDWVASRGWTVVPFPRDGLEDRLVRREQELVEFLVDRGVLVPMTRRELERFIRKTAGGVDPAAVNLKALRAIGMAQRVLWLASVALLAYVLIAPPRTPRQFWLNQLLTLGMLACLLAFIALFSIRLLMVRAARRDG